MKSAPAISATHDESLDARRNARNRIHDQLYDQGYLLCMEFPRPGTIIAKVLNRPSQSLSMERLKTEILNLAAAEGMDISDLQLDSMSVREDANLHLAMSTICMAVLAECRLLILNERLSTPQGKPHLHLWQEKQAEGGYAEADDQAAAS